MIGVDECIEFLRRCPLLESLVLSRINPSFGAFPGSKTRIHCLHLRSFELSNIFHELVVTEILNSVCLPALERWVYWHTPFVSDSMISLARYSSCLHNKRVQDKWRSRCLRECSQLASPLFVPRGPATRFLGLPPGEGMNSSTCFVPLGSVVGKTVDR
jgi:hypothetical protein